jgi:hypothetical protein
MFATLSLLEQLAKRYVFRGQHHYDLKETGGQGSQEDESPFYCLLTDDKLVADLHVEADELLALPMERTVKPSDAFAIIHVVLKPTERFNYSWVFE